MKLLNPQVCKTVKARTPHKCEICGREIKPGETYVKYIEAETGWKQPACKKHMKKIKKHDIEKIPKYRIITDASCSDKYGDRIGIIIKRGWDDGKVIFKTVKRIEPSFPTIAEGKAIIEAMKCLERLQKEKKVERNIAIKISCDNYPVSRKLETRVTKGSPIWKELMRRTEKYFDKSLLSVGGSTDEAHNLIWSSSNKDIMKK